jgi:hypothetical protein
MTLTESQGFEPWEALPSLVFKASAFVHSANSPNQHPVCLPQGNYTTRRRARGRVFTGNLRVQVEGGNRTRVYGFADRCLATRPLRRIVQRDSTRTPWETLE